MKKTFKYILLVVVGVALFSVSGRALADTYGTNFENFTLGNINAQDGWTSGVGSPCGTYDQAVVSNTYGYLNFGAKSLRISNAVTCGSFNDHPISKSLINEAGETSASTSVYSGGTRQPYFEAQWDFASTVPGSEQPGLAVVASPTRGDSSRMSWVQMQDTPTGLQLNFEDYQDAFAGLIVTTIATNIDRTVPHTVKITMQFVDGPSNDIVKVYLDGLLIHTGTSWENLYLPGASRAVDSIMFRLAGTAAPATSGKGFLFDNFSSMSGSSGSINVIKIVINDNGRTKAVGDFPLFVNASPVVSGVTNTFPVGSYTVSETPDPNYTESFSGDCDSSGHINLMQGDSKVCVITNDDIPAPSGGGGSGGNGSNIPPLIDLVKVPNPSALPAGSGTVTYTYTLSNIGMVPVTQITLVGDTCSPINFISGDTNNDSQLDTNEIWVYTCQMNLATTTTNTVTVTGVANAMTATDIASATVVVGASTMPPLIHVTKIPSPPSLPVGGGIVTSNKRVTNPGNVALNNVRIIDDECSPVSYVSGDTNNNSQLDTNEIWLYSCQRNFTTTTTNITTASGDANGLTARDVAIATIVVASANGVLVKTADNPTVYLVANGKFRPFTHAAVFLARGLKFSDIQIINLNQVTPDILGRAMGYPDGTLIRGSGPTIYLVSGEAKVGIPSMAVFRKLNLSLNKVIRLSNADLASYDDGGIVH